MCILRNLYKVFLNSSLQGRHAEENLFWKEGEAWHDVLYRAGTRKETVVPQDPLSI